MINKEQIKEYLIDFQKKNIPKLIKRELKIPNTKKIISIIGPRRAGKTYFLFQTINNLIKEGVKKEEIIYLNFEDPRLLNLKFDEVREIVKIHRETYSQDNLYIFIDEPQNVHLWEVAVRNLYDEGFKIYITGSSSKLLSKEIATSLRGRSLSYLLLPFSFTEFLKLKDKKFDLLKLGSKEKSELFRDLNKFIEFGGFPEVIEEKDNEAKLKIVSSYFELIVFKDLVERYNLRNSNLIKWLIKSSISMFSNEVSINKIYNTLKSQDLHASKNTLYEYFSIIEESFFIFFLKRFSYSERKKEFGINKIYLNDTSFSKLIEFSKEIGKKMENTVFLELLRRNKTLEEISYWKNNQQEEVDFVLTKSKKVKKLIQVCFNLNDLKTKNREIRALIKASQELNCKNLIIINKEIEKEETKEWFGVKRKIKFIPLWKWLLENKED